MKKNRDRGLFPLMWLSPPANVTLPLPLFGMDVYIQPAWWICQSCVTAAVSEIVHLLPCKIALNWGNPSVEARCRTLIKFTASEREQSARHLHMDAGPDTTEGTAVSEPRKHFNLPPGMLILSHFRDSSEWFSHYEHGYWLWRCITSYRGKKAIERLPYWLVTYFNVAILRDSCSGGRDQWPTLCYLVIFSIKIKLHIQAVICKSVNINWCISDKQLESQRYVYIKHRWENSVWNLYVSVSVCLPVSVYLD